MKDIQGIQRGKCNTCECKEYRTPPSDSPSKFRCEYCNHTPVEHVRIEKLGKCNKCGDCEEYQSEDNNSYTECGYCGCDASDHSGSEKLRKSAPQTPAAPLVAAQLGTMTGISPATMMSMMPQMTNPAGIQPRVNAQGQPVQSAEFGTCKNPGCPYPKRVEGGKVHDFCSKTCSQKFSSLSQKGGGAGPVPKQFSSGGPPLSMSMQRGPGPGMMQGGPGMMHPPPSSSVGIKLCTQCKKNRANPGRGWCEQCYVMKSSKT